MLILSKKCTFFYINANSTACFSSRFFILNVKCMESVRQKDIIDVMSFQLHVEIIIKEIKDILIHFPILKIMII